MNKLNSIKWEFIDDDTRYLTHSIHRYSSKFIPQIASTLIENLSNEDDLILDCFSGSGTTLVEANLLKRHSYGLDINPLACLISKVKVTSIKKKLLKSEISKFLIKTNKDIENNSLKNKSKKEIEESEEKLRRWYFEENFEELEIIKKNIEKIPDQNISDLALVSFSEILRRCSKASSSYPNLMIDKKRKPISSVMKVFERRLEVNVQSVIEFSKISNSKYIPKISEGDSRNMEKFKENTFDLVICHPPYVAAVPYAEFLRLSLMWLGHDPKYYDSILIGGKRTSKQVLNRFMISMKEVLKEIRRVLKKGKICALVIGNPQVHGEIAELNKLLTDLSEEIGLKKFFDVKRERINMRKGRVKDEYVILFSK